MQFKVVVGISVLTVISMGVFFGPALRDKAWMRLQNYLSETPETEPVVDLKTTRNIPADADLGAFLAGNEALNRNDYQVAAGYYEKVLQKDPENTEVKAQLFMLNGIQGNMPRLFELAHELDMTDHEPAFNKNLILADWVRQKKYKEALDFFKKSLLPSKNVRKPMPFLDGLFLAWIQAGLQNKEAAFEALEKIEKPMSGVKIQHQAMLHMFFGEPEKAKEKVLLYEKEPVPDVNTWYYILNILSFEELLQHPKLLDKFQSTLVDNSYLNDVLTHQVSAPVFSPQSGLGDAFYLYYAILESIAQQSKISIQTDTRAEENALVLLNTALSLDSQLLYRLIAADKSLKVALYQQVVSLGDAILKTSTSEAVKNQVLYQKATALIGEKHVGEAYNILSYLAQHKTPNLRVYELLINISTIIGNYQNALKYYDQMIILPAVQRAPELLSNVYAGRANIYYQMNRHKEMIDDLFKALSFNSKDVDALNSLGYELIDREIDVQKGLDLAKKAHQLAPQASHISDSVAWGYYKQGNLDMAVKVGETAVRQKHDSAVINMHLGDIYRALGRDTEAGSQYRKALMMKRDLTPEMTEKIKSWLAEKGIATE